MRCALPHASFCAAASSSIQFSTWAMEQELPAGRPLTHSDWLRIVQGPGVYAGDVVDASCIVLIGRK